MHRDYLNGYVSSSRQCHCLALTRPYVGSHSVQDLGARHDSSQLEHLIRQRREQQQASALSGSFSGGAHTMDNMRVGMRDPNFLPHHGTLLTSQLQAKFLRSRLGSALSSREDMHTLRRELQFRQQHDTGPIGRFRNVRSVFIKR